MSMSHTKRSLPHAFYIALCLMLKTSYFLHFKYCLISDGSCSRFILCFTSSSPLVSGPMIMVMIISLGGSLHYQQLSNFSPPLSYETVLFCPCLMPNLVFFLYVCMNLFVIVNCPHAIHLCSYSSCMCRRI